MFYRIHLLIFLLYTKLSSLQKLRYVRRDVNHLNLDEFQYYDEQCNRVCQKAGGYRSGGPCECKCHGNKVFETAIMRCVTFRTAYRYLLSSSSEEDVTKMSKVSSSQLKSGVMLNYCDASNCKSGFKSCRINDAKKDEMEWKSILNEGPQSDIVITDSGDLKFLSETSMFNGKLLKLDISCNENPNGEERQLTGELLIEVAGMFEVPKEKTTTPPTITTNNIPSTTTSTTTTNPKPITASTVSQSKRAESSPESTTTAFTLSTTITDAMENRTKTSNGGNETVVLVQGRIDPNDTNRFLLIFLPIAFFLLLILWILITVGCRWYWKKKRSRALSEPVSLFQPTTPVFMVDKRGSFPVTNMKDPLCTLPSNAKRVGTVKDLYAQIGKKLKRPKKQSSIDGSLDDGYITDDSDYYKRFSAFPADLYSFPGSTISLNEPDYRIPEDVNYLSSPHSKVPPYSSYRGTMKNRISEVKNSNDLRILGEFYNCPVAKFTSFKSENESTISDEEHPYDEVGGVLRSRSSKEPVIEVFYDDVAQVNQLTEKQLRPIKKKNATKRKVVNPIRFVGINNDSYDVSNAK